DKTEIDLTSRNIVYKDIFDRKPITIHKLYVGYVNNKRTPHVFLSTDNATSYLDVLPEEAIDKLIDFINNK
ncbi:MAG: hypothetical protein ACRDD8_15345, partial [Bacteroidales bacterium]